MNEFFVKISNRHIRYTVEKPSREQPFLDFMIEVDPETNNFERKTYWKKTVSGSFLHPKSNHPKHTIKSISHSQFRRLSWNASTLDRYYEGVVRLRKELKRLTYLIKWITEAIDEAAVYVGKRKNLVIDRKTLELFNKRLNEIHTTLTEPITIQNVKRVGRQMGIYFTKNIKNLEINRVSHFSRLGKKTTTKLPGGERFWLQMMKIGDSM